MPRLSVCALALSIASATTASADSSKTWITPGIEGGLSGGIHSVYATVSDALIGAFGAATFERDADLFADGLGAQRIGYRLGAMVPILGYGELALALDGATVKSLGFPDPQKFQPFGDAQLRAKAGIEPMAGLMLAGYGGINLYQGVEGVSTLGDTASPVAGLALSWLGGPVPLRAHVGGDYTHDRTLRFLPNPTAANAMQRYAWGMRDDTYLTARAAVEWPTGPALPLLEYAAEIPISNGAATDRMIHTLTPGVKVRVAASLAVAAWSDVAFGDPQNKAPALPPYRFGVGVLWRMGGDVAKAEVATPPPAPEPTAAEPATAESAASPSESSPSPVTEAPTGAENGPATATEAGTAPTMGVTSPVERGAPVTAPASTPSGPVETSVAPPAAETPAPASAPVDLEQFAQ